MGRVQYFSAMATREAVPQPGGSGHHANIAGLVVGAIAALVLHYALNLGFFQRLGNYLPLMEKLSMSVFLVLVIQVAGRLVVRTIERGVASPGHRYNLLRIARLVTVILMLIVAASFLFQNLYAAAVSFGLISLVLGFALQAPITSFIAWLYLIFRRPFHVGDRIEVARFRGDVVEVNYLDTVILECSGVYLGNDRRSGRVLYIPNSLFLKEQVVNYAGPLAPFIWNETPLQIAFDSDLAFVEQCLHQAATDDFKERYPDLDAELPEHRPEVYFRVNTYAWLEAVISYPVEPTDTTGRRTRILVRALETLNRAPDRVKFPEGSAR